MSDDKKPFTVNDRRLFTPEGEARRQPAAPEPAAEGEVGTTGESTRTRAEPSVSSAEANDSLEFIGLLVSLGAQASALLGLAEAPGQPGSPETVDLPGARGIIGLLEVLERKTAGRRSPEEDHVLAGLLYELRMAYLARAR